MRELTFLENVMSGHPIQTRDGNPAKFIAHVPEAREAQRLVVLVDGFRVWTMREDGKAVEHQDSAYDILLAPKLKLKREGWMAIGSHVGLVCRMGSTVFPSKESCVMAFPDRIVAYVEWEEEAP